MKYRRASYVACILLALAGGVVWFKIANHSKAPSPPIASPANSVAGSHPVHGSFVSGKPAAGSNQQVPASPDPNASAQPIELILQQIHDVSVTYDPRELPKIQPFLTHSDPEVRKAAVNGMIVLGDASAGAMLRNASKSAQTPHEAVAMLEAADYVELPSATNIIRKKKRGNGDKPRKNPKQVAKPAS